MRFLGKKKSKKIIFLKKKIYICKLQGENRLWEMLLPCMWYHATPMSLAFLPLEEAYP